MKSTYRIALILALVISMLGSASALAQGGLTYTSGVQVVNLEATAASITLLYYDQTTGQPAGQATDTINASSSKTYFPLLGAPNGFNGSMVVQSDKQVAAIANLVTTDFSYTAATTGFSAGATSFNLPLVMCNNSGFNTFFNIQNAGAADASVTVEYVKGSHGATGITDAVTIKPGFAKTFDQQTGSTAGTKTCAQLAGTDGKFIGSAKITSNQPVVATVMQLNTGGFKVMMGYNGFPSGSATVSLPLVMANNNGFYSGFQIQNVGTSATTVTVKYSDPADGAFTPADESCTLEPKASCTLIQNGGVWAGKGKYVGSATLTSNNAQPLVVVVNQVFPGVTGVGPFGTAYEGFDPGTGTSGISAPLIMAKNSGFYTAMQIQNVGGATCPTITVNYSTNSAGAFDPADDVISNLAAGKSMTVFQNTSKWTDKYIGGAEVSAPGCSIIAIVNQVRVGAGDTFMTYTGFNH